MYDFLVKLIVEILKVFIPSLKEASKDSYTVAVPREELKKRLDNKILEHWGKSVLLISLIFLTGCFERTVYVPDGTPVKLAETVKNVKVWVKTKDGIKKVIMDLPEGHFVLPDPTKEE